MDFASERDPAGPCKLMASSRHTATGMASVVYKGAIQTFSSVADESRDRIVKPNAASHGHASATADTIKVKRAPGPFPQTIRRSRATSSTAGKSKIWL